MTSLVFWKQATSSSITISNLSFFYIILSSPYSPTLPTSHSLHSSSSVLISRTVWSPSLTAVSWSWMVDPSAQCISTPGRALCAAAAVSPSRAAASPLSIASSTLSTLCAPFVCGSSAKASLRSRKGSHTARHALINSLCETWCTNNAKVHHRHCWPYHFHIYDRKIRIKSALYSCIT